MGEVILAVEAFGRRGAKIDGKRRLLLTLPNHGKPVTTEPGRRRLGNASRQNGSHRSVHSVASTVEHLRRDRQRCIVLGGNREHVRLAFGRLDGW